MRWFFRRCFFQRQLDWDAFGVLVLVCEKHARKIRVYKALGGRQCHLRRGQLRIMEYLDLLFLQENVLMILTYAGHL